MIAAPSLNRCEKLSLLRLLYVADLRPSTLKLLHQFIDNAASLLWSSERLAKSISRSARTVDYALAELKQLGIITTVRRRRGTMCKSLNVGRCYEVLGNGVAAAKEPAKQPSA